MPQLSPMNGFLIMFSISLMLLFVLINSHYMLKPTVSSSVINLSKGKQLLPTKNLYF